MDLLPYEILSRWYNGMEVAIPHASAPREIEVLNRALINQTRPHHLNHIIYRCLDHLMGTIQGKEIIAVYHVDKETGRGELEIWPGGERYSPKYPAPV